MMSEYYVPRLLDTPSKLVFWELDEVGAVVGGLCLGILAGNFFIGGLVGLGVAYGLAKLKHGRGIYYMKQRLYWFLPEGILIKLKATPPSHVREYVT